MMTPCAQCGGDNPADARFCIECGANMARPSVGPTVKLAGPVCQKCQTANPEGARFCVVCGRGMAAATPPPARPRPHAARPLAQHHPRSAAPPATLYASPMCATKARRHHARSFKGVMWGIGLLVLFATNLFWPGILILAGISLLTGGTHHHSPRHVARSLVWLVGLALLFKVGFWPGILVLIVLDRLVERLV